LSIVRQHFVEGVYDYSKTPKGKIIPMESAEGYAINFDGSLLNNTYYNSQVNKALKAADGDVYKIDRVLDPYGSAFGVSPTTNSTIATIVDSSPKQEGKTITDLIYADPLLNTWAHEMKAVLPPLLTRLEDRRGAEGKDCKQPQSIAIIPSNEAFDHLPQNYSKFLRAPYNMALASHLLAWGVTSPTCTTFENIQAAVKEKGEIQIINFRADMNMTISETKKGSGELRVNNARVVLANRCAGNGCIWIVDRLIDPVFGMF
jgi:uncharacterized surface protein with fasciclin (FAS1) repeats